MKEITAVYLNRLSANRWFSRVGSADDSQTLRIGSWKDALVLASRVEWDNIRMGWKNELTRTLSRNFRDEYRMWNNIVRDLKPQVECLATVAVDAAGIAPNLRNDLFTHVRWDVLCILMECEYADLVPLERYRVVRCVYERGHFPCGWDLGKLIYY